MDGAALETKRLDSLIAEHTAITGAYEAARQAQLTRLVIFSGIMSAVFAIVLEVQTQTVRIVLSFIGVLTSIYWAMALTKDHLMAEMRFKYGKLVEDRLDVALQLQNPNPADAGLRIKAEFFRYFDTNVYVGVAYWARVASEINPKAKILFVFADKYLHFTVPLASLIMWTIILVLSFAATSSLWGSSNSKEFEVSDMVEVMRKVHAALVNETAVVAAAAGDVHDHDIHGRLAIP